MRVCAWCAEELADDARRCGQCGREVGTRPTPVRSDLADGDPSWELPDPDPAVVYDNLGRPVQPDADAGSDLRLMEPKVGREQPANEKAFVSTLLAGTSKSLIGALVALHLAKQAEDEIEASDGREGGEIFITMTRVFAGITIGLFLLVLLGGLTMWLFSAIGH